jgi:hypothetical protein
MAANGSAATTKATAMPRWPHTTSRATCFGAEFVGGRAHRGSLTGNCAPDGCLEFGYSMVLDDAIVVVRQQAHPAE